MRRTLFHSLAAAALAFGISTPAAADTIDPVLLEVQKAVNYRVHFVPERGRHDVWKVATTQGDCEDIALAKREELIARGWAPEDLQIRILVMMDGTGHALLYIPSLDVVMDNEPMWKDFVIAWSTYRKVTGAKIFCTARNLTPGEMAASRRCKDPAAQVASNGR